MILYKAKYTEKRVFLIDGDNQKYIPDCVVFGLGEAKESTGIIVADENRFYYIPFFMQNVKDSIGEILKILDELKNICKVFSDNAKSLIDDKTTVVGEASIVVSTVTGEKIGTDIAEISSKVDEIKNETDELYKSLV